MDQLIKDCQEFAAVYLDDLVIFSTTWEDHLKQLGEILNCIGEARLTAKVNKCQFGMKQCVYLGHVVGNGMTQPEVSKVEVVQSFARLETKTQVRGFLGLTGYYRRFIPDYATVAAPLTDLTRKSAPNVVQWSDACNHAFEVLNNRLCKSPILSSPDFLKPFILQTDASDRGARAVLSQIGEDGEEHPVGYYSRKFHKRRALFNSGERVFGYKVSY